MGAFTLADFRNHVATTVGPAQASNNDFLDLHVNAAYLDVCGSSRFDVLTTTHTATLALDALSIALPSRTMDVIALIDETNERRLTRISLNNMYKKSRAATSAQPEDWSRDGSTLLVWPPTDAAITLACIITQEPVKLSTTTDVTVLDTRWDSVILALACSYASLAGATTEVELAKAQEYERRARRLLASRVHDDEEDYDSTMTGISVPTSWADLRDQETG